MTTSAPVILVIITRINVAETATEAAAMKSGAIVTGIANGTGTGIGMTSCASGGQRVKTAIPRATVMMTTGGSGGAAIVSRSVTGMAIGNDRGDTSASVGQAGAHEVLNTEEGMHDDVLAAAPSFTEPYTYASLFSTIDCLRFRSVQQTRPP